MKANTPILILLNGPKGCGKTAVTDDYLVSKLDDSYVYRCKDKLYDLVPEFFCITEERFFEIYEDRELKEVPMPEFNVTVDAFLELCDGLTYTHKEVSARISPLKDYIDLTVREAMIYVSEVVCKPTFGKQYFGMALAARIQGDETYIIDDSVGFNDEIPPLVEKVGAENIILVKIVRDGVESFDGDSRNWIDIPGAAVLKTDNDGTLDELSDKIVDFVHRCEKLGQVGLSLYKEDFGVVGDLV